MHISLSHSVTLYSAADTQSGDTRLHHLPNCRAIANPDLADVLADCCAILSCFVKPMLLLNLIAPRVYDEDVDLATRSAAMQVLAHIIRYVRAAEICSVTALCRT